MKNFFKKTILLLALAVVVFLGGGVAMAEEGEAVSPGSPNPNATVPVAAAPSEVLTGVDSSTLEAKSVLGIIKCGNWYSMVDPTCWAPLLTYRLYQIVSLVLMLSGSVFDFMLALSIDKVFIAQPFVNNLWEIVRNFSNMLFIFILLYAGIRTMLLGDDWKKPVMMVVVIALLINFSLFFTKIVIDAGNILAVEVYSSMGEVKTNGPHKTWGVMEHNISETLVNGFSPQAFLKISGGTADLAPTIFVIAGVISGFAAWIFFKAAFLFMGRIIAFWFLMILSPFAFITLAFPQLGAKVKFSFSTWLDMLINQAFVAPVFLFFIYIIMKVVDSKILDSMGTPSGAGFFFDKIFVPVVIAAMLVYALKKALAVADSMSDEFGKIGANLGNKALGLGLGLASGGTTMALGGMANKVFQSGALQRMAAGSGGEGILGKFVGRQGVLLADKTRNTSFDARNIKAFGIGKGLEAGTGNKDGYMKREEKWVKEKQKTAKLMEMTDTEKEKQKSNQEEIREQIKNRGNHKEVVEKSYKDAETKVNNSGSGKKVAEASNKKGVAVSMAGDASIKKLEADKQRAAAITDEQRAAADMAVKEAEEVAQKATQVLATAEEELVEAKKIHSSSKEVAALKDAEKNLNMIEKAIESDKKYIKYLDEKEGNENLRRREVYGKSVTLMHPSGWWNRSKKVDKIRTGPTPEEKAEEDTMKVFKKMLDKEKKERGEPATVKEKSEKPKEEKPPKTE